MSNLMQGFKITFNQAPHMLSRKQVHELSGGHVAVSSLACYDCRGVGIGGKRLVGKRVCYPKDEVFKWLMAYMGEPIEVQSA